MSDNASGRIKNHALYHDRTLQDWHFARFDATCWAIDIDLMGACNRCRGPLYLIESTTRTDKPTLIIERLAERARVPAFVVVHDCDRIVSASRIWPTNTSFASERQLAAELLRLRREHDCAETLGAR